MTLKGIAYSFAVPFNIPLILFSHFIDNRRTIVLFFRIFMIHEHSIS